MIEEIIIAGFGGQGVMSMGQLLAYAGMQENKQVSWLPSYGPEQRGGTANVSVVINTEEIGSPVIDRPSTLIALNNPSLEKFQGIVKENGNIIINSDLVSLPVNRKDVDLISIPASSIARELGYDRVTGMILLGTFIDKTGILKMDSLITALLPVLGKHKKHLIPVNEQAISAGQEAMRSLATNIVT